jgi:NAD(P)-dependent dehydrogenase (short-subunit alcohol dehydrogenase family)
MKKTVLITGASSGIGKTAAKLFASNGWSLVATMRTSDKETEWAALNDVLGVCRT